MFTHVFFDCDSTLTKIEGIDALAELAGVGEEVKELTRQAMEGELSLEEVWKTRLDMIRPTPAQIEIVARRCIAELTPGVRETLNRLHEEGVAT
ncbi:MAG: HAD family hydrolase [Patescibacteria group bacterium]